MNHRSTLLLEHHLKELKLPSFLREYGKMAAQCAAEGVDHPQYLLRLSELELIDRHQRMVERRIRAARFPAVKSLDTFDFIGSIGAGGEKGGCTGRKPRSPLVDRRRPSVGGAPG